MRDIIENSPAPTAVFEGDGLRCAVANAAMRALGANAGQTEDELLAGLFPSADPEAVRDVARTGQSRHLRVTGVDRRSWDMDVTPLRADGAGGGAGTGRAVMMALRPVVIDSPDSVDQQVREVSHRVKNTLQLVSSLLTLQTLSAKEPEMRRAFQEACARIGTVTQAHQRIHGATRGSLVDFGSYLRDTASEMEANFAAGGANRHVVVAVENAMLPVDSVIPLALIVNELVGNAIKYAYAPGGPGIVEISLLPLPEGGRRLVIGDHGRGLPPGFEVARADTLGMKVARAFAGQLKGKLRAESNDPGTRFIIDLPF
nr:sensor histidine kinase [Azospirillum rugosum]